MNAVRARAFKLRIAGKSYTEINRELGVAKSTLSGWFKHLVLSDTARNRLALRARAGAAVFIKLNKAQTHRAELRAREARISAKREIPAMQRDDLRIIGAVLYWAEGYKRLHVVDGKERMSHIISFVNVDPLMIRMFLRFLREILYVPNNEIHLTMRLYPHINEREARTYWTKITGLTSAHFKRTTNMISRASMGKRPFNRLPYGTLQISVHSTPKFHHLMGLIEGVQTQA